MQGKETQQIKRLFYTSLLHFMFHVFLCWLLGSKKINTIHTEKQIFFLMSLDYYLCMNSYTKEAN